MAHVPGVRVRRTAFFLRTRLAARGDAGLTNLAHAMISATGPAGRYHPRWVM